jgi:general stress protein 26
MNSLDEQKVVTIMNKYSLHAYLATSDGDQPRVRPVSPIVEDNMSVWITTYSTSRKVKHIQKNPKICLAFVEQPHGDKAATIIDDAEIISDIEEKKRVWNLAPFDLSEHFPNGPESKEFCLLKINMRKVEWRDSWTSGMKTFEPKSVSAS